MISLLLALTWLADVRGCACDIAQPATLEARECSLCKAVESQKAAQPDLPSVIFLKDTNPTKPNRMLALPRKHYAAGHALTEMTAAERTELWTAAIAKGQLLWGENWGVAYNGDERRTQCHGHLHIGKVIDDLKDENFTVVAGPAAIPEPEKGAGLWVHSVSGKLHVHAGEQVNEFNLMR